MTSRYSPANRPISDLAATQLGEIKARVDGVKDKPTLDPYSKAHLAQTSARIQKALDARIMVK